jgi:histidinol-phosphate/aromatic aminotransferase/cobyric acid decarboxylase-like protein/GNAT superfamily N-acetyltransferase
MKPSVAPSPPAVSTLCSIARATAVDCDTLHRLRHEVYARELGQHAVNETGRLRDALDEHNVNLVARIDDGVAGFISITPPERGEYSIDKYFTRAALPFPVDDRLFEVRLLTVLKPHRGRELATLLMYAALRWVEAHGGTRIVAIGRREVVDLYLRVGLQATGLTTRSGAVTYDLLIASVADLRQHADSAHNAILDRLEEKTAWRLPMPFRQPAPCFHGGAFFTAIGERFDDLSRRHAIINADVLDAWFPPAPGVLAALRDDLPWLLRTSPPTGCEGLITTIAEARGVAPRHILPGAGSSDLIFRALRHWLTPASSVLILDPTYGEYAHVLEKVIGCTVDRLTLTREQDYAVDLDCLTAAFADHYDLVVLVNPNSPTGRHIARPVLEALLSRAPTSTRFWIDETYVEYAGDGQSLERFAATSENVIVCKSMSKVYALSGARVAYLCAGAHQLEALRAITPPWVIGLPSQVAAVRALEDPAYYAARHRETARLRDELARELRVLGWDVLPGVANFLLCHVPPAGPDAATIVAQAREHGVFLRNAASMSASLGTHCVRIAVKDAAANRRIVEVLSVVSS